MIDKLVYFSILDNHFEDVIDLSLDMLFWMWYHTSCLQHQHYAHVNYVASNPSNLLCYLPQIRIEEAYMLQIRSI